MELESNTQTLGNNDVSFDVLDTGDYKCPIDGVGTDWVERHRAFYIRTGHTPVLATVNFGTWVGYTKE